METRRTEEIRAELNELLRKPHEVVRVEDVGTGWEKAC